MLKKTFALLFLLLSLNSFAEIDIHGLQLKCYMARGEAETAADLYEVHLEKFVAKEIKRQSKGLDEFAEEIEGYENLSDKLTQFETENLSPSEREDLRKEIQKLYKKAVEKKEINKKFKEKFCDQLYEIVELESGKLSCFSNLDENGHLSENFLKDSFDEMDVRYKYQIDFTKYRYEFIELERISFDIGILRDLTENNPSYRGIATLEGGNHPGGQFAIQTPENKSDMQNGEDLDEDDFVPTFFSREDLVRSILPPECPYNVEINSGQGVAGHNRNPYPAETINLIQGGSNNPQ